ncbi:hypothetical protein OG339_48900 (plasmid) [Streptosporangium sp. NBC_01495]|uniref:hypothetical protein n=1 Tax=Streptosporangium sp. NBC_01495 TaxID=2903899 RepID=UPI002E332D3C|nr:hypothetical protein [Streptosporangium sp. NBC_01495]
MQTEIDNFLNEKRLLIEAMVRKFRNGAPAGAIATSLWGVFEREQVMQYLEAVALQDRAGPALRKAGLDVAMGVCVTGLKAPREARLALSVDPAETPGYASLPARARAALANVHITLAPAGSDDDDHPRADPDDLLLDGEPVRLIDVQARSGDR